MSPRRPRAPSTTSRALCGRPNQVWAEPRPSWPSRAAATHGWPHSHPSASGDLSSSPRRFPDRRLVAAALLSPSQAIEAWDAPALQPPPPTAGRRERRLPSVYRTCPPMAAPPPELSAGRFWPVPSISWCGKGIMARLCRRLPQPADACPCLPWSPASTCRRCTRHRVAASHPWASTCSSELFNSSCALFRVSVTFSTIRRHTDSFGSEHDDLCFVLNIELASVGVNDAPVCMLEATYLMCVLFH